MKRFILSAGLLLLAGCRTVTLGPDDTGMAVRRALAEQTRPGPLAALDAEDSKRTLTQHHVPTQADATKQQVNLIKQ